jgi:GTPase SAR1 family protein
MKAFNISKFSSSAKANIVILGLTGHGKSTLVNLLLDSRQDNPDGELPETVAATSPRAVPETKFPTPYMIEDENIQVIDTPGLGEGDRVEDGKLISGQERDATNVLNTLQAMQQMKTVNLIIICTKDCKFTGDAMQKYLKYIKEMFTTDILDDHVLFLLTNTNPRKRTNKEELKNIRSQREILEEEGIPDMQKSVKNILGTNFVSPVHYIDMLPIDIDTEGWTRVFKIRKYVIDLALKKTQVNVQNLRFPKPDRILQNDKNMAEELIDENMLKCLDIQDLSEDEQNIIQEVESLSKSIAKTSAQISNLGQDIMKYNTKKLEVVAYNTGRSTRRVEVLAVISPTCNYKIAVGKASTYDASDTYDEPEISSDGKSVKTTFRSDTPVIGKTGGELFGKAFKKDVHKVLIDCMIRQVQELKKVNKERRKHVADFTAQSQYLKNNIEELQEKIEERNQEITKLTRNYLSIDEAIEKMKAGEFKVNVE